VLRAGRITPIKATEVAPVQSPYPTSQRFGRFTRTVAIETERAISGHGVARVLDRLALSRGLPQVIRTDNDKEFCGKAMVTWAY
jgi:hypothetical protein